MMFENSLKIARILRRVHFKRIFKYHEYCKSLIARAFIRLFICYSGAPATRRGNGVIMSTSTSGNHVNFARLGLLTGTMIILDITKTSSNNCL